MQKIECVNIVTPSGNFVRYMGEREFIFAKLVLLTSGSEKPVAGTLVSSGLEKGK